MATYLITGGCGFIGSHVADALVLRGDHVRILDNLSTGRRENVPRECEVIVGDVSQDGVVASAMRGVDGCWHLAAIASVVRSNEEWLVTHRTNLTGTIQVLDAARYPGNNGAVPVVYASSAAVYGNNPSMPLTEDAQVAPLTAYGADKLGSELHARVATQVHGVPTVGFRFFNVFGKRQDPASPYSGVISIFVDRIRRGEAITVYGDGEQTRDFVHVSDVVRFLLAGMGRGHQQPEVHNVCTGRAISLNHLLDTLFRVAGRKVPVHYVAPRPGDIRTSLGSPARSTKELGFMAHTTLEQGLKSLLAGQ